MAVLSPSKAGASVGIIALLSSLMCLGTWPALLRLCTRGEESSISFCGRIKVTTTHRHACHAYIDYAFSYVMSSTLPILLSLVVRRIFSTQEQEQMEWNLPLILVAMVGGALLSIGNLSMQWATCVFGAPLTTVLAMQASLTVVIGTSINYALEPQRTARPDLLGCGVAVFLTAIVLATWAQTLYLGRNKNRAQYTECGDVDNDSTPQQQPGLIALPAIGDSPEFKNISEFTGESFYSDRGSEREEPTTIRIGLYVAFCGGLCFGFFSPAFNIAVNDPWGWSSSGLTVAMANMVFSLAFCFTSIFGNVRLMTHPPHGIPQSTLWLYVQETFSERRVALLAGLVCAMGNLLQFQGGKLAGFAAADMVQAYPLVATVWDLVMFGEFRHATKQVLTALILMYVTYLLGIVLMASSIDY